MKTKEYIIPLTEWQMLTGSRLMDLADGSNGIQHGAPIRNTLIVK